MKTGYILLVHSKFDPIAWLIRKITKSYWNHVAWAIDSEYLLEARARAIDICPITKYLNWKYKVKLIRLNNITKQQLNEGICYAMQFRGKRSYFKYLKTIFRLFLYGQKVNYYGLTCSNLIARGLEEVGYYFMDRNIKNAYLITPDDISKSNYKTVSYELNKENYNGRS